MPNNSFPEFHRIVTNDMLRPAMNHAIVRNGKLIGTNSHALAIISLDIWVEKSKISGFELPFEELTAEQQLENLEGKAFHYNVLKELSNSKIKHIRFEADRIVCFTTGSKIHKILFYSAKSYKITGKTDKVAEPDMIFTTVNPHTGEMVENDTFTYVNYEAVIGSAYLKSKGTFDLSHLEYTRQRVPVSVKFLSDIASVFKAGDFGVIVIPSSEFVNKVYYVVPVNRPDATIELGNDEFGLLMPIILKD